MLAELYYATGATITHIADDIASVLTGALDKNLLSASLVKASSSIDASKETANWTLVNANAASTVDVASNTGWNILGAKILSQPCSTDPTKTRFFKFLFAGDNINSTANNVIFLKNIGTGSAANLLTGHHGTDRLGASAGNGVLSRISPSGTVLNAPAKVSVYSSPKCTIIGISNNDEFSMKVCAFIGDFEPTWLRYETSGIPFVLAFHDVTVSGISDNYLTVPMSIDGFTYGLYDATYKSHRSTFVIGSPKYPFGYAKSLYTDATKKFSGFKENGTKYDMYNFGVVSYYGTRRNTQGYTHEFRESIVYSSITDVTGVYLINRNAFGRSGTAYATAAGTFYKFGMYMVEVG